MQITKSTLERFTEASTSFLHWRDGTHIDDAHINGDMLSVDHLGFVFNDIKKIESFDS